MHCSRGSLLKEKSHALDAGRGAFRSHLDDILRSLSGLRGEEITLFAPMIGRSYDAELMVIGRAVNGWSDPIAPDRVDDADRERIVESALPNADGTCPMAWIVEQWSAISGYSTKRSAFWRVTRDLARALEICTPDDPSWSSRLAWSNLYKAAPPGGGNPTGRMRSAQREACERMLRREIEVLCPRRLVFLTGLDWADTFLRHLDFQSMPELETILVDAVGHIPTDRDPVACAVAKHPQGKNESTWVHDVTHALRLAGAA